MSEYESPSGKSQKFIHAFKLLKDCTILIETEEAESQINDESVSIKCNSNKTILISYRDIENASSENYRVKAIMKDGTQAEFYYLGHNFDSFSESFFKKYNSIIKKDSFMGEETVCVKHGACFEHTGSQYEKGECDLSLGKHALIVQRINGMPARLPYALIDNIEYLSFDFNVDIYGDTWNFSMLGHEYDGFKTQYSKCYKALVMETSNGIKSFKDDLTKITADQAASLFLDGRPVQQAICEKLYPGLWKAIFDKACEYGGEEYFNYLRNHAAEAYIGFKDSLIFAQGNYIWMMAHIGGFIVFEAASSSNSGMATYVFSIRNSADYTMKLLNYCMHMTEFRREPIFLSDDELKNPENAGYLDAIHRVPQINILRELYKGRLMHISPEKWVQGLQKMIT